MTKFEKIIERAISDAESVKCPFPEFVEGLKAMREEIDSRLAAAIDEMNSEADPL